MAPIKRKSGWYLAYFPFALWIEVSKDTPYHKKFLVRSREMWCIIKETATG